MDERADGTYTELTEADLEILRKGCTGAAMLVALSDRGFFDTFREAGAIAKHFALAKQATDSPVIRRVAEGRGTGFGLTASAEDVEAGTLEALRAARELLQSKAPGELGSYRAFVLELVRSVSAAAGGGDEAEAQTITTIENALT